MKNLVATLALLLFTVVQAPVALAANDAELRAEADRYYQEQNFKKAHKLYVKLARTGHYYAQDRVAQMHARGEGKPVDFTEAYAWAVLAEEGGDAFLTESSESLLARADDQAEAQKKAEKLLKKYGQDALEKKAQRRAEIEAARRSGSGMGSNLSR